MVELGKLVNAIGGFGWRKMTRVPRRRVVRAFHAAPGAVLVGTPPQIAVLIAGEVTRRGTGMVGVVPRRPQRALGYLHHAGIGLVLQELCRRSVVRLGCCFLKSALSRCPASRSCCCERGRDGRLVQAAGSGRRCMASIRTDHCSSGAPADIPRRGSLQLLRPPSPADLLDRTEYK